MINVTFTIVTKGQSEIFINVSLFLIFHNPNPPPPHKYSTILNKCYFTITEKI